MRGLLHPLVALALGDHPEQVPHLDAAGVRRHADGAQVAVDPVAQRLVVLELEVRLPEVERADVADREQRVAARVLGVREDPGVQVEVVVRLRLVDVARTAARDGVERDQLEPDLRRQRTSRGVSSLAERAARHPV